MDSCKHEKLCFGSDGFYVICGQCNKFWVAIDFGLGQDDEGIEYTRAVAMSMIDYRIKRDEQVSNKASRNGTKEEKV